MSDRLAELFRQRELVQHHLTWLDGEIARAADQTSPTLHPPATAATPPSPVLPGPAVQAALVSTVISRGATPPVEAAPGADVILDKYRVPPRALQQDVRKGCFLYFAAAFVLVGLGVIVLYFAISSR